MTQTKVSAAQSNKAFFGLVDNGQVKEAADMVTGYTRLKIRESSVFERAFPSTKIDNSQLTPLENSDMPHKLCEMEPDSPAAVSLPIGGLPIQFYMRGHRFPVYFERISTPKAVKNVDELRTYGMDIRSVMSDNMILDMDYELDRKLLAAVHAIVGAEGSSVPETGVVQHKKIVDAAGVTRSSLMDLRKILPSTFARLETAVGIVNNITVHEIAKLDRAAAGGDLAEDWLINGYQNKKLLGIDWIVTIKNDLVPNNCFVLMADPSFVGKNFVLEDTTMYMEKKDLVLTFYASALRGATISNVASVALARIATA